MSEKMSLQSAVLKKLVDKQVPVTAFMTNGFQMRGVVVGFDEFTVVIATEGQQNLVYKHAISTLTPAKAVNMVD